MKVRLNKTVHIKGTPYEYGQEYEVDEGLGEWMIDKNIAVQVQAQPQQQKIGFEQPEKQEQPKETHGQPDQKGAYLPVYQKLLDLAGSHLVEIYGQLGTGKSRFAHSLAVEAQVTGQRVYFMDTEGGLTAQHQKQLDNYEYVGDSLDYLMQRVSWVNDQRDNYDILIVDSIGHPVYVHYVEMGSLEKQLKSYQKLAVLFRDMVRFARGERGKDMGKRSGLSIAINHTVSEFARAAKESTEQPLDPFGGQIHRVPKLILRSEPVAFTSEKSTFNLWTFKARNLPRNRKIAQFIIQGEGLTVNWLI